MTFSRGGPPLVEVAPFRGETISLDSFGVDFAGSIVMNGDEKIGSGAIGARGLIFKRDEFIGIAGGDDFQTRGSQRSLDFFGEQECVFFFLLVVEEIAWIFSTVAGGDDDSADLFSLGQSGRVKDWVQNGRDILFPIKTLFSWAMTKTERETETPLITTLREFSSKARVLHLEETTASSARGCHLKVKPFDSAHFFSET